MKIQDVFSVTIASASDIVASTLSVNPILRGVCAGLMQSFTTKGWEWASELPQARELLRKAESIGLYNHKTGDVDGEALLGFLDGYVGSGSSFEFTLPLGLGKVIISNEELKTWVEKLRELRKKEVANGNKLTGNAKKVGNALAKEAE